MSDERTLEVYGERVEDYTQRFSRETPDADLQAFIDAVPWGGRVLDLGCGPGHSAALMLEAGLVTEAWDATPQMVIRARRVRGLDVLLARFEDLDAVARYDGIWANFSLLHAPRAEMAGNIARIARALSPRGLLHLGLKRGTGEKRDALGRFYSYFEEDELREMLADAGFEVLTLRHGEATGLAGTTEPFIVLLAKLG